MTGTPMRHGIALGQFRLATEFALQSIWRARRRLILAVLGVGIGFAAIHTLAIIGHSAQEHIRASLDSLGGDIVTLSIGQPSQDGPRPGRAPGLQRPVVSEPGTVTLFDATRLLQTMHGVESATWAERGCQNASNNDGLHEMSRIPVNAQTLLSLKPAQGRLLMQADHAQDNVLLGAEAFKALRQLQPHARVGSFVRACGRRILIVGILQSHPGSDLVQAFNINHGSFVVAEESARPPAGDTRYLLVRLRKGAESRTLGQQLRERMALLLPGYTVEASAAWDVIRIRQEQTVLYTRFLAALGAISLLVGTLGIANMMLLAVAERRTEIGLRMAIGALRRDIVLQFMVEGVLICLIGSAAGLLVAGIGAYIALLYAGFDLKFPELVIIQATLLALVCGIAAAAYPAYRAAAVDPYQSLLGSPL